MERDYFSDLADNGQLDDPATALIYSMAGWGTDETIAREAMEAVHGMSPEEREKFNRKFGFIASQMGYTETTLEEWIDGDFGKDEALDLKIQALGAPTTPEDHLRIARMRHEHALPENGGLFSGAMRKQLGSTTEERCGTRHGSLPRNGEHVRCRRKIPWRPHSARPD